MHPLPFYDEIIAALSGGERTLHVEGRGDLDSAFAVTDLAAASVGAAGTAISDFADLHAFEPSPWRALKSIIMPLLRHRPPGVAVDRRLASFWFAWSLRPDGWEVPPAWDAIAGDYEATDGWIKLHTNAPHHRDAALRVLSCANDRDAVAAAVAQWSVQELEDAIVAEGGCAARMMSLADWQAHPQGRAIAAEPLIHKAWHRPENPRPWSFDPERPLADFRVLDLTRVLAGPVAGRFLAAYGAKVLRIDPPWWEEPGVVPEVTLGKRCAGLDLGKDEDRETFRRLLSEADILLHGYRPGALEGQGFGEEERRAINPNLTDVSLCAYGWTGPWAGRRGFDSLVQLSSGIAHSGMTWKDADKPVSLPVQALDHATGYLMAAAAIGGLSSRLLTGDVMSLRLSLARTAHLLTSHAHDPAATEPLAAETAADLDPAIEQTSWGPARRLRWPLDIEGSPARWDLPAGNLRASPPDWPETP